MSDGIYTALSGARAQTDALDIVANNVANASTAGYREQRVAFGEVLAQAQSQDMAYVSIASTGEDVRQGELRGTGNPLDLALLGEGYFAVDTSRGVRYTRAGTFRLDPQGQIVDGNGNPVLSREGGPIAVPDGVSRISVDASGVVRADDLEIGSLDLAVFAPGDVRREGDSLYAATQGPVAEARLPEVVSGSLEGSNVNVVRGMVGMVRVSRTYEALLRMIESYKQVDARTARDIGGPK